MSSAVHATVFTVAVLIGSYLAIGVIRVLLTLLVLAGILALTVRLLHPGWPP